MRAFLIDPYKMHVSEVDYSGDYKQIYKFIQANCFDAAYVGPKTSIFVDDNGLLNNPTHFFAFKGYPQPLAGYGLVTDYNPKTGNTVGCHMTLQEVLENIIFLPDPYMALTWSRLNEQDEEMAWKFIRNQSVFQVPRMPETK